MLSWLRFAARERPVEVIATTEKMAQCRIRTQELLQDCGKEGKREKGYDSCFVARIGK
jgi:hypothetical protein